MELTAAKCFFCSASGRVDWRDAIPPHGEPQIVTMESHGMHMKDCPHCNGLGVVPVFAHLNGVDLTHLQI